MRKVKLPHVLAAGVVLLGGTVACSGEDSVDANSPSERVENADVPEDRADEAVHAALGRIDPCALIDLAGTGIKRPSGEPYVIERSPHSCDVDYDAGSVSAEIGARFSTEDRFDAVLDPVAGAKAYVAPSDDLMSCQAALPVSFTHAIMFHTDSRFDVRDPCDDAKAFARAAVKRLKQPASVAYPKGAITPTACELMRPAVDLSDGEELRSGQDAYSGIDICRVATNSGDGEGSPLDSAGPGTTLSIEYRKRSFSGEYARDGKVRGRKLARQGCRLAWNEPKVPESADGLVARFELANASCETAKGIAREITKVIDQDRVAKSATAQRPVLYEVGEPDAPALGACIDVMDVAESECLPYAETDAPSDGEETIEAAGEDPNVNCAIAAEAVKEHFGANLRPVTVADEPGIYDGARMCGFVEESHALEVRIGVSNDPMQVPGESEIGGHPAGDGMASGSDNRQVTVALSDEDEPGVLFGEVLVRPARGDGEFQLDEAPLDKLDEAMTDIVEDHFNA